MELAWTVSSGGAGGRGDSDGRKKLSTDGDNDIIFLFLNFAV